MIHLAKISGIVAVLALTLATDGVAQQATSEENAPTSPIEDGLNLGEPAELRPGQPYTKSQIGAFELRCVRSEDPENDPCQLYQLLADADGQPIAEFSLFRLPEGGRAEAGATIIVPLETALQQQLTIQVDEEAPRRYPFSFCNQIGCYARIGLTPDDVLQFKRGGSASFAIVPMVAQDQTVSVSMSLSGFTAGFDEASVLQQ